MPRIVATRAAAVVPTPASSAVFSPASSVSSASPVSPVPVAGPLLFARYAYGPNRLGYCGPDEAQELFEQASSGHEDNALRALARRFEGAYPYLELIARSSGIADPLDPRVVEAYWLGSPLLETVTPRLLGESLERRFRSHLRGDGWRWLATKPEDGALPVHAFHVLDVFPRVGLMRSGSLDRVLETMDSCRIRWGRVEERIGDWLVVSAVPLAMVDGRLTFGAPRHARIRAWRDGAGFLGGVEPGDVVSIHWDWACDRLDRRQLDQLVGWTTRELEIANRTI